MGDEGKCEADEGWKKYSCGLRGREKVNNAGIRQGRKGKTAIGEGRREEGHRKE